MDQVSNPSHRWIELWTEMATRMAVAGLSATPGAPPPEAARQVRSAMFNAMSRFTDQFMRTPEFLELTKQTINGAIQLREQFNEMLTKLHHDFQGVALQDVECLLAGMHQLESRVVDRLEVVTQRLDEISKRLDALENGRPEDAEPEQKKPRRQGR